MNDWEHIAQEQSAVIDGLSLLCSELISELAQHRNVEAEEKRLEELEAKL